MTQGNVELIGGVYSYLETGDIISVLQSLGEAVEWRPAEHHPYDTGQALHGPDEVLARHFARLAGEWDGFAVTPLVFHNCGDVVLVEGRYSGRQVATDKMLDAEFCHVWFLKDGQVTSFREYTDTAQFRVATGADVLAR